MAEVGRFLLAILKGLPLSYCLLDGKSVMLIEWVACGELVPPSMNLSSNDALWCLTEGVSTSYRSCLQVLQFLKRRLLEPDVPYFSFKRLLAIYFTLSALDILALRMPERRNLFYSKILSFSTFVTDGFVCTIDRYRDKFCFSKLRFKQFSRVYRDIILPDLEPLSTYLF